MAYIKRGDMNDTAFRPSVLLTNSALEEKHSVGLLFLSSFLFVFFK